MHKSNGSVFICTSMQGMGISPEGNVRGWTWHWRLCISRDYGHMTIEHASMLLRRFGSLKNYSNQGFEASHIAQRQLYSRATSHDGDFAGSSCKYYI